MPEATDGVPAAGSTTSGRAASGGDPPVALFLLVAVGGVLIITSGWFIAGRRSSEDEKAVVVEPGASPAGRSDGDGPGSPGSPRPGGRRAVPIGPSPTIAVTGTRAHDPLVAAMERSRDPRSVAHAARAAKPIAVADDPSSFNGPTWVRRLDPRIRVAPELKAGPERAGRGRKDAASSPMADEDAERRSA